MTCFLEQTALQTTTRVDRIENVLDDLQLLRVELLHDVPQVDAPNLEQHLIVDDLLQQLQVLHREEHVYASLIHNIPTLKVQILNVVQVVVEDRRQNHLQLLVIQLRLYASLPQPSLTHEAQHFDVPQVAAFHELLQHVAVHPVEVHLYRVTPPPLAYDTNTAC